MVVNGGVVLQVLALRRNALRNDHVRFSVSDYEMQPARRLRRTLALRAHLSLLTIFLLANFYSSGLDTFLF